LKRNISPKFFKSLAISPVTAWVVAQAPVTPGGSPKLIRSDAEGAFDKIALEFAKDYSAFHYSTIESRLQRPVLHVHLLVYKIVDGLMAVNFALNDNASFCRPPPVDIGLGGGLEGRKMDYNPQFETKAPLPRATGLSAACLLSGH